MSANVSLQVPASTSNLGAGFDCIGVALDLWLRLDAALYGGATGFAVTRAGTLAGLSLPANEDRLVLGFRAACEAAGCHVLYKPLKPLALKSLLARLVVVRVAV